MRSKLGYLFGGFLIAFAAAVAGLALSTAISTTEGMQRVTMPGHASITLPAGPSTLYAESEPELAVECTAPGLALRAPASAVRYALAGYHGHAVYEVDVAIGGRYELTCQGPGPFAVAIGAGVGAWMVVAVLATIPAVIGVALVAVTMARRRRAARRGQKQAPASGS